MGVPARGSRSRAPEHPPRAARARVRAPRLGGTGADHRPRPGAVRDLVEHVVELRATVTKRCSPTATPLPLGEGVTENDLAGLFYTGGTTGASKGVMLSHRNLIANAFHWMACGAASRRRLGSWSWRRCSTPPARTACWRRCGRAATQVTLPAFDPAGALDLIERHGVTATLGVPTMLAAIADEQHARPRATGTRCGCSRTAARRSPTEVIRRTHGAFPDRGAGRGLRRDRDCRRSRRVLRRRAGSARRPARPLVRARACPASRSAFVDADGDELPRGERRRGASSAAPNVMPGYWNKPEQTRRGAARRLVLDRRPRLPGRRGLPLPRRPQQGHDRLGRRERVLAPRSRRCCTSTPPCSRRPCSAFPTSVGRGRARGGRCPAGARGVDAAELIAFCRERIAGYKVPEAIDLRTEPLPKSGPGKILKRELRAPFWNGRQRP